MFIARVIGHMVSTKKDPRLVGAKLLLIRAIGPEKAEINEALQVAVDSVGAGIGEYVLVVRGTSARLAYGREDSPVDCATVGILDSMDGT